MYERIVRDTLCGRFLCNGAVAIWLANDIDAIATNAL